jgi:cytochrome c-type biogenesis protein CcmE
MSETENPSRSLPRPRLKSRQIKFLIGGIIIAAAVGYLIFNAAGGSAAYYVTIQELQSQDPSGRAVRVAGQVLGDTIVWEPRDQRLAFSVSDESGQLPVVYEGARPDMFRDGAEVVLVGRMGPEGVFEARSMILKCPSKYEEAQ